MLSAAHGWIDEPGASHPLCAAPLTSARLSAEASRSPSSGGGPSSSARSSLGARTGVPARSAVPARTVLPGTDTLRSRASRIVILSAILGAILFLLGRRTAPSHRPGDHQHGGRPEG